MIFEIVIIVGLFIRFSKLAFDYDKNRWVFGILGGVTYFGSAFIFGIVLATILMANGNTDIISGRTPRMLNIVLMAAGLGSSMLLYYLLKRNWQKKQEIKDGESGLLDAHTTSAMEDF